MRLTALVALTLMLFAVALSAPAGAGTLLVIGQATYNGKTYNLVYEASGPNGPIVWLDYTEDNAYYGTQAAWADSLNSPGVLTYRFFPGYTVIEAFVCRECGEGVSVERPLQ